MTQIDNIFSLKKTVKFICNNCDFKCCYNKDFKRHLNTIKHNNNVLTTNSVILTTKVKASKKYECLNCDKTFNDRAGLWRHKKKCSNQLNPSLANEQVQNELIQYLMKENSEFKQLMIEQNKSMIELAKTSGNNTTNNNQQFNLNFYLNETCKNAMNIMDFVSQLQFGTKELEETGRLGFAEGISKIFINGLKQINIPDRPIHCSDTKRETLYIKDNNEWNKETDDKIILTNAIKQVAHKNMKQISEWTKIHPLYKKTESKENDKYLKIVSESMSGSSKEESNKNYSKIIKNIVKETVINKSDYMVCDMV
jgi:hypothetical protein